MKSVRELLVNFSSLFKNDTQEEGLSLLLGILLYLLCFLEWLELSHCGPDNGASYRGGYC